MTQRYPTAPVVEKLSERKFKGFYPKWFLKFLEPMEWYCKVLVDQPQFFEYRHFGTFYPRLYPKRAAVSWLLLMACPCKPFKKDFECMDDAYIRFP